jgi:hypothetical protein
MQSVISSDSDIGLLSSGYRHSFLDSLTGTKVPRQLPRLFPYENISSNILFWSESLESSSESCQEAESEPYDSDAHVRMASMKRYTVRATVTSIRRARPKIVDMDFDENE